jgi:GNAT superfamily N-acetyltransferase
MEFSFRVAKITDVEFIAHAIMEAEKGVAGNILLANIFNLSHLELHALIIKMLEEEIDGCEFSLSSYIIAEHEGIPAATMAGWLEGHYDNMPSSILNANLINYTFPKENIAFFRTLGEILKDLRIERTMGTYQTEYVYVDPNYRGNGLMFKLFEEHVKNAMKLNPEIQFIQGFPFRNNLSSAAVCNKFGFKLVEQYESKHPEILKYANDSVRLKFEKKL